MNYSTIITIIGPILGIGVGYFIRFLLEKRKELSGKIYDERRALYQKFIDLVIDILKSTKRKEKLSDSELSTSLFGFYKKYILYASPEVINSFSNYFQFLYRINEDQDSMNPYDHFQLLTRIMIEMRKDLGLKNRKLGKNGINIMRALITDIDKYKSI